MIHYFREWLRIYYTRHLITMIYSVVIGATISIENMCKNIQKEFQRYESSRVSIPVKTRKIYHLQSDGSSAGGGGVASGVLQTQAERPPMDINIVTYNVLYNPAESADSYLNRIIGMIGYAHASGVYSTNLIFCLQEVSIMTEMLEAIRQTFAEHGYNTAIQQDLAGATKGKRTYTLIAYPRDSFDLLSQRQTSTIAKGGAGQSLAVGFTRPTTFLSGKSNRGTTQSHAGSEKNFNYIVIRPKENRDIILLIASLHGLARGKTQAKMEILHETLRDLVDLRDAIETNTTRPGQRVVLLIGGDFNIDLHKTGQEIVQNYPSLGLLYDTSDKQAIDGFVYDARRVSPHDTLSLHVQKRTKTSDGDDFLWNSGDHNPVFALFVVKQ